MTGRRALFWLLSAVMLGTYFTMIFWSVPMIINGAGGLMPFDVRPFGYSEAAAREFLTALNDDGRAFYLGVQRWIDTAFPALMAVTLAFAFAWVGQGWNRIIRYGFIAAAFVGAGFDYLENSRVAKMLIQDVADISAASITAASQATVIKFSFDTLAVVGLLAGLKRHGYRRSRT